MAEPAHPPFPSDTRLMLAGRMLDMDAGVLRDAHGTPIALRPQAWAVLALLARHPGRVVSKSQLFDGVWPGRVVTDSSIARAVSDLRAAFGSDGHRIIRTAARRGYLLMAHEDSVSDRAPMRAAPLPAARGPLFGRTVELAELCALMTRHRLVTIVGTGGVGKTAIAVAAVHALAGESAGEIGMGRSGPTGGPPGAGRGRRTVARAADCPGRRPADRHAGRARAVVGAAGARQCRTLGRWHLPAGAGDARRCAGPARGGDEPGSTASRIGAGVQTAPLEVPAPGASLAEASGCGSVALFVDQAHAMDRHFELGVANLGLLIELCRRLEGLPLAIRLAAARLPLMGLAAVVARLHERLQLLASGSSGDAPAHQQTLLAALDWSYSLLRPPEQALFRRLGVFVGGFSLDMAITQARCDDIDEWTLIEGLNVLVERGLVDVDPRRTTAPLPHAGDATRVRVAAVAAGGRLVAARQGHAVATDAVMRQAEAELWVTDDDTWLSRWAPELDNVRAATGLDSRP